ncbi:MAG: TolC family protein [Bacteroidota bacterium]|nr:TolC family protein [Bacteroidota bacterium]
MQQYLLKVLIVFLFFGFVNFGFAQSDNHDEKEILSLDKALTLSMENNLALNRLSAETEQVKNAWKSQSGLANPELIYYQNGMGETDLYFEQAIGISQSFEKPLQNIWLKKIANLDMAILQESITHYKIHLIAMVKMHYVEVLYALYFHELTQERVGIYESLKEAVDLKHESGTADLMNKYSASVKLYEAKNRLSMAESDLHKARYNLFEVIGLESDQQLYTIGFEDSLQTHENYLDQHVVLDSLSDFPGVRIEQLKIQRADEAIKSAKAAWFPSVSVSYLRQDFSTGYEFNGIELGVEIPLWGARTINPEVKVTESKMMQQEWHAKETLLKYKRQVEHAWHAYEKAREVVLIYQNTLGNETQKLLDLSQEAYLMGEIDLINLLEAQNMFLNNQEIYLSALRDYYTYLIELEKFTEQKLVY